MTPFQKTFAQERARQGSGGQFDFEGKQYNTNTAEDSITSSPMELEARRQAIGQKAELMPKSTPGNFNYKGATLSDPTEKQTPTGGVDRFAANSSYANKLDSNIPDNPNTGSSSLEASKYDKVTQQDVDNVSNLKEEDGETNYMGAFADALSKRPEFKPQTIAAVDYGDIGAGVDMKPNPEMQNRRDAILKMMGRG